MRGPGRGQHGDIKRLRIDLQKYREFSAMLVHRHGPRILMYSHDTFGLGHLRRCRAIAHSLVGRFHDLSVLILTGSPIIGAFDFSSRVDFVRVPGVIKLRNGDYTALNLKMDIDDTVHIRQAIIERTAEVFAPDIMIVDKEPLGFRGEMERTLHALKSRGATLVLGLRDVLDEIDLLRPEWERKGAVPALESLYDEIWIYGTETMFDPLEGLALDPAIRAKTVFTGYLPRPLSDHETHEHWPDITNEPYLLVTTGGGGDGEGLIDWVLTAYETQPGLPLPALMVLGPFMPAERQVEFQERAALLNDVEVIVFHNRMEELLARARAVVCMGGYNTFCEVLTFDRPALIVPRMVPRREQLLRTERAAALGLVRMLIDPMEDAARPRDPAVMANEIDALMDHPLPSSVMEDDMLSGFETVERRTRALLGEETAVAAGIVAPFRRALAGSE
jgi:predicted glycosyltransferase